MQLNITTDYAIRIVLFVALAGRTSAPEIAPAMGIPLNYVRRVARQVRDANILRAEQGAGGGYTLARKPEGITLFDIVDYMEGTTRINRCLEPDHFCSRNGTETCPVRKSYEKLQGKIDEALKSITIAQLVAACG